MSKKLQLVVVVFLGFGSIVLFFITFGTPYQFATRHSQVNSLPTVVSTVVFEAVPKELVPITPSQTPAESGQVSFVVVQDTEVPIEGQNFVYQTTPTQQFTELNFIPESTNTTLTPFTLEMLTYATLQPEATLAVSVSKYSLFDLMDMDLDQLWGFVDEGGLVGMIAPCSTQPTSPYVTWSMAHTAAYSQDEDRDYEEVKIKSSVVAAILAQSGISFPIQGTVRIPEETVKSKLKEILFQGNLKYCLVGNYPVIYGSGVEDFLDWVAEYIYL